MREATPATPPPQRASPPAAPTTAPSAPQSPPAARTPARSPPAPSIRRSTEASPPDAPAANVPAPQSRCPPSRKNTTRPSPRPRENPPPTTATPCTKGQAEDQSHRSRREQPHRRLPTVDAVSQSEGHSDEQRAPPEPHTPRHGELRIAAKHHLLGQPHQEKNPAPHQRVAQCRTRGNGLPVKHQIPELPQNQHQYADRRKTAPQPRQKALPPRRP